MSYTSFPPVVKSLHDRVWMPLGDVTLSVAIDDLSLDRPTLRVLNWLVSRMGNDERTALVCRRRISEATGLEVKSVSNCLSRLRRLGYIVSEKWPRPDAVDQIERLFREVRANG